MSKKIFFYPPLWSRILLVIMFIAHPASAVDLSVEDTSGAAGEEVTASILIDDTADLLSADITLGFDLGVLTVTGAETTSLTSDWIVAYTINWGEISISLASDLALTGGSGALADITFSISEDAEEGETPITISDALVYGSDYQPKEVTTVDGTVTIGITATTSTTNDKPCLFEELYGDYTEETELLRRIRDEVLSHTEEGQEIIRLYYEWSPAIVRAMEEDDKYKEDVKEMLDGVLLMIRGDIK